LVSKFLTCLAEEGAAAQHEGDVEDGVYGVSQDRAETPSRLTKKFPANFTESICEIMYKLDTNADYRMMECRTA
jgi:hypothetical protein